MCRKSRIASIPKEYVEDKPLKSSVLIPIADILEKKRVTFFHDTPDAASTMVAPVIFAQSSKSQSFQSVGALMMSVLRMGEEKHHILMSC